MNRAAAALTFTVAMVVTMPACAHGLLMQVDAQGNTISGTLYFTNGQRAGGVWIELFDAAAGEAALATLQTAADGSFRMTGRSGRRYEVRATGEEGHRITMAITLAEPGARGTMVRDAAPASDRGDIPAWAVLGSLLTLSTLPALWLRRRRRPV